MTASAPTAGNSTRGRVRVETEGIMDCNMAPSQGCRLQPAAQRAAHPIAVGEKRHTLMGVGFGPSEARSVPPILRETRDGSQEEVVQEGQEVYRQTPARQEEDGSKAEAQSRVHEGNASQRAARGRRRRERAT